MASSISPEEIIGKIEEILCGIGEPFVRRINHKDGYRLELNYPQSRRKQSPKTLDPRAACPTPAQQSTVPPSGIRVPQPTLEERAKNLVLLNKCLKDLDDHGVPRQNVMAILSSFNPAWKRQLTFYASLVRDVPYLLMEERDWRKKLMHHAGRIEYPALPESLKQSVLDDSLKAIELIEHALRGFQQAQKLLAPVQTCLLRKGAWFSQARRDLIQLITPAIESKRLSRNRAARRIFELLKAWAPEEAPASVASVRSGSYEKKEINVRKKVRPLPSP